ncbi:MAG: folate-binding protein [Gammaproteobacteria bacterium]|nr:MAG: folate-binding protein [Gammaproteobacteria bacterium]
MLVIQPPFQVEIRVPKLLAKAEIVEINGADAAQFAHAQFCSDVLALPELHWQIGAWLDAQGRARCVFVLLRVEADRLLAWLPMGSAATMATELQRFVLRAKVKLSVAQGFHLMEDEPTQLENGQVAATHDGWCFNLPGPAARTMHLARNVEQQAEDTAAAETWRLADVMAGLPWLHESLACQFTAQALGLDRLGAASLDKGCYPGQEIVARLHFRGGNKRHCMRVVGDCDTPPQPGTCVLETAGGTIAGTILYAASRQSAGFQALAVLSNTHPTGAGLHLEGMPGISLTLQDLADAGLS